MPRAMMLANRAITVPETCYRYIYNPNSICHKENNKDQLIYALTQRNLFIERHGLRHLCEEYLKREAEMLNKMLAYPK
jgi:hypothetical protein